MTVLDRTAVAPKLVGDRKVSDSPKGSQTKGMERSGYPTRRTRRTRDDHKDVSVGEDEEDKENNNSHQDPEPTDDQPEKEETKPGDEDQEGTDGVDYEAERQRNILRNQQLLMELGLNSISIHQEFPVTSKPSRLFKQQSFNDDEDYVEDEEYKDAKYPRKKRSWRPALSIPPVQTRSSKRIRGEPAKEHNVNIEDIENGLRPDLEEDEKDTSNSAPSEDTGSHSNVIRWKGRKQTTGYVVEVEIGDAGAPLTLALERRSGS
ncbi:hypothetical protein B0O80DRAFT_115697 [Mortierella sp. GBAus27b]|nr:hypothetical protein B0O80DRAFT_115697 [Mortierella sp. GBAus27b]